MPQRKTAPLPSHIPVGQPPYIFDVDKHKFDGLFIDRTPTHFILFSILSIYHADDPSTLFSWIAPSIYDISMTLFHTHCICYVFYLRYHRHIASVSHKPSLSHPPTYVPAPKEEVHAGRTYSHLVPGHTCAGTRWSSFRYEKAAHVIICCVLRLFTRRRVGYHV